MKAIWNGAVIAESDDTVVVEGNHYFPADSVDRNVLRPSDTHTVCPWKGTASYWTLEVDGQVNRDAQGRRGARPRPGRLLEGRHRRPLSGPVRSRRTR